MKACVTGATGFVGAHVARALAERGDEVRVIYRNPQRLKALHGVPYRRTKADVLHYAAMRRALRGSDVLFHVAGYVASSPVERVWELNAAGPTVAVEAAAAEGVRRVVLTSTISAIGTANGRPADESTPYPEDWLGLVYPDSKHAGERAALEASERHGVELVVVNPGYVLGVPVNRSQPGETSTRTIGNYLRGRLPGVVDAPMNFVDVEDVADGHLLAGDRGSPGERYILGGVNLRWPELIDRVAELSGVSHPIMVLPTAIRRIAQVREALGLPGAISAEAFELMGQDWRFSSGKARDELGFQTRPLDETLADTIDWYLELIESGAFDGSTSSGLSRWADSMQMASRLGLLTPVRVGQRVVRKRFVAGV
ncbi:MAG TPA: NAD-dependent epimerase/dehydratase family protein [Solirubrobacteraceae bacterium]|nr:NAD-dependent epimerase/dehydratase family protein [Solirubrobacteraceae bacterium]